MTKTYMVFRNGNGGDTGSLADLVAAAVIKFYEATGKRATTLRIHPTLLEKARALDLAGAGIEGIEGNGGALVGEVWLTAHRDKNGGKGNEHTGKTVN